MHSVVVSRFLRKEKASGSNPDVSNFYIFLLKFMCHNGTLEKISIKNVYFIRKVIIDLNNVVNEFEELKREMEVVLKELNKINNTNYDELLNAIEYNYYNKRCGNVKFESKEDNRAIKIIKEFISVIYRRH